MCLIAAQIGLAAGQAGLGIAQQQQVAKRERQVHGINQELAHRDALRVFEQNAKREQQEVEAASSSIQRTRRESEQALGLARASAGTTAGADFEALLGDFERQRLTSATDTIRNLDFTRDQIATANEAQTDITQSRVLSSLPSTSSQPDFLGALFRIGAAGLDAYSARQNRPRGRDQFTTTSQP